MSAPGRASWYMLSLGVISLDQVTKYAVEYGTPEEWVRPIIPGLLNLVHRHNPGVAFGLLADSESNWVRLWLILFSVGVMVLLAWLLAAGHAAGRRSRAGLALILGGAAGNVLDRILHSSVIDFVNFYLGRYHWPAFNVADSAIVIGAGLVILELLGAKSHQRSA